MLKPKFTLRKLFPLSEKHRTPSSPGKAREHDVHNYWKRHRRIGKEPNALFALSSDFLQTLAELSIHRLKTIRTGDDFAVASFFQANRYIIIPFAVFLLYRTLATLLTSRQSSPPSSITFSFSFLPPCQAYQARRSVLSFGPLSLSSSFLSPSARTCSLSLWPPLCLASRAFFQFTYPTIERIALFIHSPPYGSIRESKGKRR